MMFAMCVATENTCSLALLVAGIVSNCFAVVAIFASFISRTLAKTGHVLSLEVDATNTILYLKKQICFFI